MNESKHQQIKPIDTTHDERNALLRLQRNTFQAEQLLSRLEAWLREHSKAVDEMKIRCSRLQEEARVYITRECNPMSATPKTLAETLLAGGATSADLVKLISTDRLPFDSWYKRLYLKEPDDLKKIKELDTERATVDVLRSAVELQKNRIAELRKEDMAAVNRALGEARRKLASAVLAAVEEFKSSALLEHEREIVNRLAPEELKLLEPASFPNRFLSVELIQWLQSCVAMGLIEESEISELSAPLALA